LDLTESNPMTSATPSEAGGLFAFHPKDGFIDSGDANSGNRGREENGSFPC
jgi:hypothetical protein